MINLKNKNLGFIALISVILISVILLLVVTSTSFDGFYSRFNIFDYEMKERSSAIAESCADIVLLKIINDVTYIGGGSPVIVSGTDTCVIDTTSATTPNRTFVLHAIYNNSYTNLQIIVAVSSASIIKWEEI